MAISFKIDFENKYEIDPLSEDLRLSSFRTVLKDGSNLPIYVQISNEAHVLLPNVFNLGFGPLKNNRIDDKAELTHADYSKVFSSVLLSALTYLTNNPAHSLGIDGSDNRRAYLYYRAIEWNFDYLNRHFEIWGLKYYVRITRFGKTQYEDPFDFDDIIPDVINIEKDVKIPAGFMYNYFIFNLKK